MRHLWIALLFILFPSACLAIQNDCVATQFTPVFREGEATPCQQDLNGNTKVTLGDFGPGENATSQTLTEVYTSLSGVPQRYTTTGDKGVKASFGEVVGLIVWSGTGVTVTFFDDADGVCNSTQVSGVFTPTVGRFESLPFRFSNGICMTIAGTSPDITVVYK